MMRRRLLALAAVGTVLLPLLSPAAAGASSARPATPAVATYVETCNEQGNDCTEVWDLPQGMFYTRNAEGQFDFTNTRDWFEALGRASINPLYPPVTLELLYKFEVTCDLIDIAVPDVPVVGGVLEWIVGSVCGLLRPFVTAIDWAIDPIATVLNTLRLFVGDLAGWALARSTSLLGRIALNVAEPGLNLVVDVWSAIGGVPAAIGSVFISGEDLDDLGEQVLAAYSNVQDVGSNLGDIVSNLSFYDASDDLCWASSWGPVCPLWMFTGSQPPSGFAALGVLWVGFWVVFVVVQGISVFSRATDS